MATMCLFKKSNSMQSNTLITILMGICFLFESISECYKLSHEWKFRQCWCDWVRSISGRGFTCQV